MSLTDERRVHFANERAYLRYGNDGALCRFVRWARLTTDAQAVTCRSCRRKLRKPSVWAEQLAARAELEAAGVSRETGADVAGRARLSILLGLALLAMALTLCVHPPVYRLVSP